MATDPRHNEAARRGSPTAKQTALGLAPPPLPQRETRGAVPPPLPVRAAPRAIESSSPIEAADELLEPEELATLRPGPAAEPAPPPLPPAARPADPGVAFARTLIAAPGASTFDPVPITPAPLEADSALQARPVNRSRWLNAFRRRRGRRPVLQGVIAGVVASSLLGLGFIAVAHRVQPGAPSDRSASHPNEAIGTTPQGTAAAAIAPVVLDVDRSGLRASTSVPTCEALLGGPLDPKLGADAADREARRGKRQLVLGDADAAQTAFCRVALSRPHNIDGLLNLAQLLVVRRDGAQAAQWAGRALALDPHSRRALGTLGDALIRTGKVNEARTAWLAAENRSEPHGDELALMIRRDMEEAQRMLLKVRDLARAERMFRRVVAFDPKNVVAMVGVAKCLRMLGEKDESRSWDLRAQALASSP